MIELILLLGLAWVLRNWLQAPTNQDCDDWIVMNEFDDLAQEGVFRGRYEYHQKRLDSSND